MLANRRWFWVVVTGLLLLVAASRLTRLNDLTMNRDEIWSVWQTMGTPQQIIQWTPYDWPPGYYLTLGAWRGIAGAYPLALRMLSVLAFLIGTSFVFRVMRRWQGIPAGVLAALAYAALGFGILLSLEVRGYALLMGLWPLALWLTIRYFDHPTWRRAVPLALALAAMFYLSLTSFGAFLMLAFFTLLIYRQAVWRWWLPGLMAAVLAAPEIVNKSRVATARIAATQTLAPSPLPQALLNMFSDYAGYAFLLWIALFVVAAAYIVFRRRDQAVLVVGLGVWAVGMPVAMYFLNPVLGFFSARYAWWIMLGIALWIGWGLARLPRAGLLVSGAILIGLLFMPLPNSEQYQIWDALSPLGDDFAWLRQNMQWGDVILGSPDDEVSCGEKEEWDYYLHLYFPNGLKFVDSPGDYRRLWVLNPDRQPDDLQAALKQNTMRGRFVGPPECLFRLYEGPPDAEGILFDNGMRFHGAELMEGENPVTGPLVRHEGESLRVRLWWSVDRPPGLDYSVNTHLARGGTVYDQIDGPPMAFYPADAPPETSRWQPGTLYVEERDLTLPYPAAASYRVNLIVYFWEDPVPISAPGVDDQGRLPVLRVPVRSY